MQVSPEVSTVCVVGSMNMDLVIRAPSLPSAGQTTLGGPFNTFPGGKGANQAVAAARAGGRVSMVGCVGLDSYGETMRVGLANEGIDVSCVHTRNTIASGIAIITVDDVAQNTIVVAPGANATLDTFVVEQATKYICDASVLLLQLEVPIPSITAAAKIARASGAWVVLNPAPVSQLDDSLLSLVDVLIPNETEAAALTGIVPDNWDNAERAARALQALGPQIVIITLGERGVLLLEGNRVVHQKPFRVDAVDTTAAGDAFVGALAVALADDYSLTECVAMGAAAGALATTVAGAQPSLPYRPTIEHMFDQ